MAGGAAPELITVIVSTYERPRELRLVLEGLACSTSAPRFEVKVCDDGSGPATAAAVADFRRAHPEVELEHCWHEDRGFRAAAARNLGLRAARGDYVVFLDGDCIPFADFLARHAELARAGRFFVGDRHFLDKPPSDGLDPSHVARGGHEMLPTPAERKRVRAAARKIKLYQLTGLKRDRPKLITANAAAWRADIERVNGLDERFVGWGHEDDDLGRRLRRTGIRPGSAFDVARVAHLWHLPQTSFAGRVRDCPNEPYFSRGFFLARCARGLVVRAFSDYATALDANDAALANAATSVLTSKLGAPIPGILARETIGTGVDLSIVCVGVVRNGAPARRTAFVDDAQARVLIAVAPRADASAVERERHERTAAGFAARADVLVTIRAAGTPPPTATAPARRPAKLIAIDIEDGAPDGDLPSGDAIARALEAVRDAV